MIAFYSLIQRTLVWRTCGSIPAFVCFQWALILGIEHERIHLETSSVLIRQLPASMVVKPPAWRYAPAVHGMHTGIAIFLGSQDRTEHAQEENVYALRGQNFGQMWSNEKVPLLHAQTPPGKPASGKHTQQLNVSKSTLCPAQVCGGPKQKAPPRQY